MDGLEITRFGRLAILIEFARRIDERSLSRCRGLLRWLDAHPLEGVVEITPAFTSILLEFESEPPASLLEGGLRKLLKEAQPAPAEEAPLHEIPVCYDGPDLAGVARLARMTAEEVIAIHSTPTYSVFQIGFSPGFPYLGPLDRRLHLPRLSSPRPRIEAGSVAIGGGHTGIYTVPSPGGWHLLGHTSARLFDSSQARGAGAEKAFALRQGDRVRFVAGDEARP